jgi:hypothetical protein
MQARRQTGKYPAQPESDFLQRIVSERLRHGLPRHFEPTRSRLDSRLAPL